MRRIWKYDLKENGVTTIQGRIRNIKTIMVQDSIPRIWIEMDDDYDEISIDIVSIGTGWEIPTEVLGKMKYINSVIVGDYVWHYHWTMTPREEEK